VTDEKPHHCSSCAHDNCAECGTDYGPDDDEVPDTPVRPVYPQPPDELE
jgi:hypothetical protein